MSAVELLLGGGEAQLLGYERLHDKVEERFADGPTEPTRLHRELWAGAVSAAAHLHLDALDGRQTAYEPRPAVRSLLKRDWEQPTSDEAALLGRLDFEHDDSGRVVGCAAQPSHLFRPGSTTSRLWRAGPLAATPAPQRLLAAALLTARDLRSR